MRVDIKVPFKCTKLNFIQDVRITICSKMVDSDKITRIILSERHPTKDFNHMDFNKLPQDDFSNNDNSILGYFIYNNSKHYLKKYDVPNGLIYGLGINSIHITKKKSATKWTKKTNTQHIMTIIEQFKKFSGGIYTLLGLGSYDKINATNTEILIYCNKHNVFCSISNINTLTSKNKTFGCMKCKKESITKTNSKPLQYYIDKINNNGHLTNEFTIQPSEKMRGNYRLYKFVCAKCSYDEYVQAGVCDGVFYATLNDLSSAHIIPCRCSTNFHWTKSQYVYRIKKELEFRNSNDKFIGFEHNPEKPNQKTNIMLMGSSNNLPYKTSITNFLDKHQGNPYDAGKCATYTYIHVIMDSGVCVGVKYGKETVKGNRVSKQNLNSIFDIKPMYSYRFPSVGNCTNAENECKRQFCPIFTKREVGDGYTETTTPNNIDKIIAIYEKWGGVKQN